MKTKKLQKLRLGMINYWNLRPFHEELTNSHEFQIDIKTGVPIEINKWLKERTIDIAPCSSICLGQSGYEMALPLGVSSDGPVMSVYLGFQNDHKEIYDQINSQIPALKALFAESLHQSYNIREASQQIWARVRKLPNLSISNIPSIRFSRSSATSVALSQILYTLFFGVESYKIMSARRFEPMHNEHKPIELIIGDEALVKKPRFYATLDLGKVWKEITNFPFVFAVWQSKGLCLNGWRRKLQIVAEIAENRMRVDPFNYLPDPGPKDIRGNPIDLRGYWNKINYKLGPNEIKGLMLFLCLSKRCRSESLDNDLTVKLIRWQELAHQNNIPYSI